MPAEDRLTIGVVCSRGIGPERGGRARNEDTYLVCRDGQARYRSLDDEAVEPVDSSGVLLVVADGMGGHQDGDLASSAAVRAMARLFKRGLPSDPELHLHRFVLDAHRRLHAKVAELGPVRMGTTLTAAWVLEGRAYWCHVGDSRLYLFRKGKLVQVTADHTRAEFARRDGRMADQDGAFLAQNFVYGSRGFGDDAGIRIDAGSDTGSFELQPDDRLLLCSDGLSGPVDQHRIASGLQAVPQPQAAAVALMERALAAGGDDNVTVIVARVDRVVSTRRHYEPAVFDLFESTADDDTLVPEDFE